MAEYDAWLALAAFPGHVSWLLWAGNNIHATAWPYKLIKGIAYLINSAIFFAGGAMLAIAAAKLLLVGDAWPHALRSPPAVVSEPFPMILRTYLGLCTVITVVATLPWLVRRLTWRDPALLRANHTVVHDIRSAFAGRPSHRRIAGWIASIPFNQSLEVRVQTKHIALPRLPPALHGLRIVHLSDIHMTGDLDRRFYHRIVELTNEAEPDLVLITGDIVENPLCWDWLPETLGKLRPQFGSYFIFGNHDIRIDHEQSRAKLIAAGLIDVGLKRVHTMIDGVDVVLAGNALPWLAPAVSMDDSGPRGSDRQLRVLLSHSPDQIAWARRHDFDLMLAGHVHGGQIQIPPLGPILAPSRYGVRYACGVFDESPTVLHVSRGLSSKLPLRFFCAPELAVLVLESPTVS